MKKLIIYSLAIIGAFSIGKVLYDITKRQMDASDYLKKCEEVKVGMTLEQAKKIMGDYDYTNRKFRSEIWTFFNNDSLKVYYLTYPTIFAASTGTEIYFDPNTQLVTKIVCGE